ncbi:unnamed protein product [Anisakis simplex]|nr:unnamed protein product [Anisakis simplex]
MEDPLDVISADKENERRMSIERIYQKKSQLEHILLRPDTYIGSVEYTDRAVSFSNQMQLNLVSDTF